MPGTATTYWTETVVDASPDRAIPVAIAALADVAANSYAQHLAVICTVAVTPGTGQSELDFFIALNSAAGSPLDGTYLVMIADAAVPGTMSFQFNCQLPIGSHSIVLVITQDTADTDTTIDAVCMIGFVGD